EVEGVRLAVQGGGDGLAVELIGQLAVCALGGVVDEHHFHLPSASSRSILPRVAELTVATSRYVTDVVVTICGAKNKRYWSSSRAAVPYTTGGVMNAAG